MSDLRDHIADLLTDADHEQGCTFPGPCICLLGRLEAVLMTDPEDDGLWRITFPEPDSEENNT